MPRTKLTPAIEDALEDWTITNVLLNGTENLYGETNALEWLQMCGFATDALIEQIELYIRIAVTESLAKRLEALLEEAEEE